MNKVISHVSCTRLRFWKFQYDSASSVPYMVKWKPQDPVRSCHFVYSSPCCLVKYCTLLVFWHPSTTSKFFRCTRFTPASVARQILHHLPPSRRSFIQFFQPLILYTQIRPFMYILFFHLNFKTESDSHWHVQTVNVQQGALPAKLGPYNYISRWLKGRQFKPTLDFSWFSIFHHVQAPSR